MSTLIGAVEEGDGKIQVCHGGIKVKAFWYVAQFRFVVGLQSSEAYSNL